MFGGGLKVDLTLFAYGGIHWAALESIVREYALAPKVGIDLQLHGVYGDALISRSRSREMSRFLDERDSDVLVMVDRDIAWSPGDLTRMAKRAHREDAIVGGVYSCRAFGSGAQRLVATNFVHGGDKLHYAEYLATGFIAFPRRAMQRVLRHCQGRTDDFRVQRCKPDVVPNVAYWDFFRPFVLDGEYLSEDYAALARARTAAVSIYASENPVITHWGEYGFTLNDVTRGGSK